MTEPTLPTPDELGKQNDPAEDAEEEGEKYQGGGIPRVESDETQDDN
jgi:hypothetical protein